jgi:hypothetical protein
MNMESPDQPEYNMWPLADEVADASYQESLGDPTCGIVSDETAAGLEMLPGAYLTSDVQAVADQEPGLEGSYWQADAYENEVNASLGGGDLTGGIVPFYETEARIEGAEPELLRPVYTDDGIIPPDGMQFAIDYESAAVAGDEGSLYPRELTQFNAQLYGPGGYHAKYGGLFIDADSRGDLFMGIDLEYTTPEGTATMRLHQDGVTPYG